MIKIKKLTLVALLALAIPFACTKTQADESSAPSQLEGTWQLISETKIEKGDTTFTPMASDQRFIKIINKTHFAFMRHDLNGGKDSTAAVYVSGGGTYSLKDSVYTENLEFCNFREWENHTFNFTVKINNDTLVQQGIEKIEDLGIERIIIEKYSRTIK